MGRIEGPWLGDACGLVDAYRRGELSPLEALEGSLRAIETSRLNAFSYLDGERARLDAAHADVSLPFGGVPIGVKELDPVAGWPYSRASLAFAQEVASYTATYVERLRLAGAVLVGQTTASEFGGINCTASKLHGVTRNPWDLARTPGGSSGGSAAAVAGGLVPLATGGDGGGSIRIPAGFTGLFGLKSTFGRIPKGPKCIQTPHTLVLGCLSRSVRDTARFFDVCNGYDARDTLSLPRVEGFERGLGTFAEALRGRRLAIIHDFGQAVVAPAVAEQVERGAALLVEECGLVRVEVNTKLPQLSMEWALSNLVALAAELGDRYPACEQALTPEIQIGMNIAWHHYDLRTAAAAEQLRLELNEAMADLFAKTDFVATAVNPDVAFVAEGPMPTTVGGVDLVAELGFERAVGNNGALTFPANLAGNPAISVPIGLVDNLPVGMQVIGRHHDEQLLLDLALAVERAQPWPLVAPGSPW
jgi:Asp-tRNA(Asn)/Glu-tRNA(Gln) amidotransferase A subunit family amidase